MNRRPRPGSAKLADERLHRFLRPGALARLRDSRIVSRSPKLRLQPLPPSSSPPPVSADQIDGFPCFAVRIYGPRVPQRKKLAASKSFSFHAPSPGSPTGLDPADQVLDFFGGVDLVAAH